MDNTVTNLFEPTGATSTPYKTPGDDGEEIELSNLDPENTNFDPDDIPLLTDFMNEDQKESVVDKTIQFIKDKYRNVDLKKIRSNRLG